ncbi:hypothetical protein COOONC_26570 [Cooperia oncophora]
MRLFGHRRILSWAMSIHRSIATKSLSTSVGCLSRLTCTCTVPCANEGCFEQGMDEGLVATKGRS